MIQPHIQLDSLGIKYALLAGDPARLDKIALQLEDVEELAYNREFRSLKGTYKGIQVLAMSTGIGGSSMAIAVEELSKIGITTMIRIGSCGALQKGIKIGDLIIGAGAVRDDGASNAYVDVKFPAVPNTEVLSAIIKSVEVYPHHIGIIHSHESFYIDDNAEQEAYWSKKGVLGADMESAALMVIGRLRGVRTASILNNVVEYGKNTADAINDYSDGVNLSAVGERKEIEVALKAFYLLDC
ncbi:MAG: nucleoside phosphorylase [Alphaproteobacteria bacterium]|nr:nucleoside phosphorylase [Alphaproteobacteria bacterium]